MTLRAVITDWGGVLTPPLNEAIAAWLTADQIDVPSYKEVMRTWFNGAYNGDAARAAASANNLIHGLEDGSLDPAEFERLLALELKTVDGQAVVAAGLLTRMFAAFHPVEPMYDAILRCREAGIQTALLSNSWGNDYPRDRWTDLFDTVVISGEVGMRKPAAEIFHHTTAELGLTPPECVFIDDIESNIEAAERLGMTGLLHTSPEETRAHLATLFKIDMRH